MNIVKNTDMKKTEELIRCKLANKRNDIHG